MSIRAQRLQLATKRSNARLPARIAILHGRRRDSAAGSGTPPVFRRGLQNTVEVYPASTV
jgi:hypothetical protein